MTGVGQTFAFATEQICKIAAIEASERALSCLASRDDLDAVVNARLMLARSLYAAGRSAEAIRRALKAVVDLLGEDLARSAQHGLNPTVNVRVWLTLCHADVGEFETGAVEGTVAVRLAAHPSCVEHEFVWSRVGLGRLQVVIGAFASAIETLEPALSLCEDQWEIYFSRVASSLGSAYVSIGRIDEGLGLLQEADSRARKIGFTFGHAWRSSVRHSCSPANRTWHMMRGIARSKRRSGGVNVERSLGAMSAWQCGPCTRSLARGGDALPRRAGDRRAAGHGARTSAMLGRAQAPCPSAECVKLSVSQLTALIAASKIALPIGYRMQ